MSGRGVTAAPNLPVSGVPIRPVSAAYLARFSWRERRARSEGMPGARISGYQPVTANRSPERQLNRGSFSPDDPWMKLWPSGRACRTNRPETADATSGRGTASVGIAP